MPKGANLPGSAKKFALGSTANTAALVPLPLPFPAERVRFDCTVTQAFDWPEYAGSMLRGAFGHALRAASCVTGATACGGCPLRTRCAYSVIFDPPSPIDWGRRTHPANTSSPPAYVVEPPMRRAGRIEAGECFSFHMVLIGSAMAHHELIVAAVQRAVQRLGDGQPGSAHLDHWAVVNRPNQNSWLTGMERGAHIHLTSPLCIQHDRRPIKEDALLMASDVIMAAVKRVGAMAEMQLDIAHTDIDFPALTEQAKSIELGERYLTWTEYRRRSNRQQRFIPLGGLIGSFTLTGDLAPFAYYLHVAQWLHIGKEYAFGLGGIAIKPLVGQGYLID